MANYGSRRRGEEQLRDWLLGGNRKRQILECLVDDPEGGWSAEDLAGRLTIGPATVYETFRALRGAGLLESPAARRHRLVDEGDLAVALRALVVVLREEGRGRVDRPPRTRT
jgi:DNA-binding transcriptional ArsR family regulator